MTGIECEPTRWLVSHNEYGWVGTVTLSGGIEYLADAVGVDVGDYGTLTEAAEALVEHIKRVTLAEAANGSDFNQRVGASVARHRKALGWSQAKLAQQLTDRGYPFQQQMVLKVEKGTRPLKFEEAYVIADLLGMSAHALVSSPLI